MVFRNEKQLQNGYILDRERGETWKLPWKSGGALYFPEIPLYDKWEYT